MCDLFLEICWNVRNNYYFYIIKQAQQTSPMRNFIELTAITGRTFYVKPNHKAKTFTIWSNAKCYQTLSFTDNAFKSSLSKTGDDWAKFFQNEYYFLSVLSTNI